MDTNDSRYIQIGIKISYYRKKQGMTHLNNLVLSSLFSFLTIKKRCMISIHLPDLPIF